MPESHRHSGHQEFSEGCGCPILGKDFFDAMTEVRELLPHKHNGNAFRGISW
jgi:hypothetical protein